MTEHVFDAIDNTPHILATLLIGGIPAIEAVDKLMKEPTTDDTATDLAMGAVTAFLEALVAAGYRVQPPNTVLIPTSLGEARVMQLISERYLREHD
jgi:hypothetical protein